MRLAARGPRTRRGPRRRSRPWPDPDHDHPTGHPLRISRTSRLVRRRTPVPMLCPSRCRGHDSGGSPRTIRSASRESATATITLAGGPTATTYSTWSTAAPPGTPSITARARSSSASRAGRSAIGSTAPTPRLAAATVGTTATTTSAVPNACARVTACRSAPDEASVPSTATRIVRIERSGSRRTGRSPQPPLPRARWVAPSLPMLASNAVSAPADRMLSHRRLRANSVRPRAGTVVHVQQHGAEGRSVRWEAPSAGRRGRHPW